MAAVHMPLLVISLEATLAKVAKCLGRWGATPNILTCASLIPAVACGIAAGSGAFLPAAIFLLLSGVLDLLDGSLARLTNSETRFGALLDSSLDRISDAAPAVGLILFFAPNGWVAVFPALTLVGAFQISYVRARAESLGAKLPWLWMRRSDRLIVLTIALLLGSIHLPGISLRAPLTLAVLAPAYVLNFFAFVSALLAARKCLDPQIQARRVN